MSKPKTSISVWISEDGAGLQTERDETILSLWDTGSEEMELYFGPYGEEPAYHLTLPMLRALGNYLVAQADQLEALERIKYQDEVQRGLVG